MSGSRVLRAATAMAVVAPLSGGLLLLGALPAAAAVTNPGDGAAYASETTIGIRAEHGASSTENRLTLTSPGGAEVVVARSDPNRLSGGALEYALDLSCWTFPSSSCRGRVPAPNGTWVLAQSGGATDRTTFTTRIPPSAPTAVAAAARSTREMTVAWTRGAEPDLTGFAVFEGGAAIKDGIATSACEGTRCSTVIAYAADSPGEHSYVVRAYRSVAPGSSDVLASSASSPATATLAAPAPPPPASAEPTPGGSGPAPSGDGSASPSGGGGSAAPSGSPASGSPASPGATAGSPDPRATSSSGTPLAAGPSQTRSEAAVAQRRAFASGFSAFGPKLGIPKLPPLPQVQAQEPAIAAPLPDGTFSPTLGFQDQVVQERIETLTPGRRITSIVDTALDSERLARSTAGALVLLLAGAHLRRWIGTAPQD